MNMILTLLLGLLTVVAGTPGPLSLPDINILPKPNLDPRWSAAETLQITLAFRDAQFMAVAAYDAATSDNEIYRKYFPETVSWTVDDPAIIVRNVFKSLFAGQLDGCGGKTLEDVLITQDFDVPGNGYQCTNGRDMAMTIYIATSNPTIILCPPGMKHGVVGRSTLPRLPGFPPPVTCNTIGDRTSWRMNTLGLTILHEWTHIVPLVGQALASTHRPIDSTVDELNGKTIYGPIQTQAIADNQEALYIAENYVYFAAEAFWSKQCGRKFGKPGPGDDADPLYGGQPGTEALPLPGP